METMQTFYNQLCAAEGRHSPYCSYLVKLTQLHLDQLTTLKSILWWNSWGINEA